MATKTLAIFTPTYNRAYKLPDLYEALLRQTSDDFVWLVVDDGSKDGTEELVQSYIDEGRISIRYIYKENGGKQRAHNTALENCSEELFLTIDSDDYPTDNAVEVVISTWQKWRDDGKIAGLVSLYGKTPAEPFVNRFKPSVCCTTVYDLYHKHHFVGDAVMVYRTALLKQYPFELADGERFIGEDYVMLQIDDNYQLATLNEIVAVHEYLEDGYSKNVRKVTRENPKSYMKLKRMHIDRATNPVESIKSTALYLVGAYYAGVFTEEYKEIKNPLVALPSALLAKLLVKYEFSK